MKLFLKGTVDRRVAQTLGRLRHTHARYALAHSKKEILWKKINPIISHDTDITLYDCDRMDFLEYFEQAAITAGIEQQALYRQGYMDCVQVFKHIGLL